VSVTFWSVGESSATSSPNMPLDAPDVAAARLNRCSTALVMREAPGSVVYGATGDPRDQSAPLTRIFSPAAVPSQ
jgi:hypothetical protein